MKKYLIVIGVILFSGNLLFAATSEGMRTGVVEFDEKNNIGLENAGVIIPEILVSHLKNVGKYNLTERVFLKKVLEEQQLQISGIIDGTMVGEVGKIFGLEAIVCGSAMKIADTISISGRVIKTETGKIIASGTVKFNDIAMLEENLEELAHLLSGFTKAKFKKLKVKEEIAKSKYGVRFGAGVASDNKDSSGSPGLLLGLFYHGKFIDVDFIGVPPIMGDAPLMCPVVNLNLFTHFGIGAGYLFTSDGLGKTDELGVEYLRGQFTALLLGINLRATSKLKGGLYMGPSLGSSVTYNDANDKEADYVGGFLFDFPAPALLLNMEYFFTDNLSLGFVFIMNGSEDEAMELKEGTGYGMDLSEVCPGMNIRYLLFSLGYSFSI